MTENKHCGNCINCYHDLDGDYFICLSRYSGSRLLSVGLDDYCECWEKGMTIPVYKCSDFTILYDFILYDTRFRAKSGNVRAILVLAEIMKLSEQNKPCLVSNRYFANKFGFSVSTVKRCLALLKEFGYIKIEYNINFDYTRRYDENRITEYNNVSRVIYLDTENLETMYNNYKNQEVTANEKN